MNTHIFQVNPALGRAVDNPEEFRRVFTEMQRMAAQMQRGGVGVSDSTAPIQICDTHISFS